MKNFCDLLATDYWLDVVISGTQGTVFLRWPLLTNLDISVSEPRSILVDGMEVIDFGCVDQGMWRLTLDEPFYRWRHRVTGQGWLFKPQTPRKTR